MEICLYELAPVDKIIQLLLRGWTELPLMGLSLTHSSCGS